MPRHCWLPLLLITGCTGSAEAFDERLLDPALTQQRAGPIGRGSDDQARELLGRSPRPLPQLRWLDGKRRSLTTLKGSVVVIRNFTHTCPYCASTMPALAQIAADYRDRGVQVLGVYHPKPKRDVKPTEARRYAKAWGLTFPVAVDPSWSLVESWWLDAGHDWTSVTWVLDRAGVVRWVHPGGEYHQGGGADHARCRADEAGLRALLDALTSARPGKR